MNYRNKKERIMNNGFQIIHLPPQREKAIATKIDKGKQSVAMQRHEEAFQNSLNFLYACFKVLKISSRNVKLTCQPFKN